MIAALAQETFRGRRAAAPDRQLPKLRHCPRAGCHRAGFRCRHPASMPCLRNVPNNSPRFAGPCAYVRCSKILAVYPHSADHRVDSPRFSRACRQRVLLLVRGGEWHFPLIRTIDFTAAGRGIIRDRSGGAGRADHRPCSGKRHPPRRSGGRAEPCADRGLRATARIAAEALGTLGFGLDGRTVTQLGSI